ncbi:MAG TPA: LuxR C-terminal-related transcriptional regulator [Microlunatus sp.]
MTTTRTRSTAAELEAVLLEAKLTLPPRRSGSVSRGDLIRAARARNARVVGVTAPAGYGKSTLLSEWAAVEDRRVVWVSLDRLDDDPSALLSVLAAAYGRIAGLPDLVTEVRGLGLSTLGRAGPRLASALRTSPVPFVLMLDDLHELQLPACHDVLSVVISGIPAGSQLVVASRAEQPHLPRLRVSGDLLELGPSDLALDAAAAAQIFSQEHVHLTPELAGEVTNRTEGWPVGLHLAAIIARASDGDALAISGEDRYVADFLYREALQQLPEAVQQFLRRTAVLDQLGAPLCDAVLEDSGSEAQLRVLEANGMFVVPLDRHRGWYRYHGLFREFLLAELRRVEPDVVEKLHLRAADWYEANGSAALAVEHLLNTTERDRCLHAMAGLALPTYQAGQLSTVQRWLSTVGERTIETYPPLAVLAAWAAVLTGQSAEAQRWAAFVDSTSFDPVPSDGTASFASSRALLRALMCRDGSAAMMTDANVAVAEEPPWSIWRAVALLVRAEAQLLSARDARATALFKETHSVAVQLGNVATIVVSQAELAILAMDRGDWIDAAEHVGVAMTTVDECRLQDHAMSLLAFAAAARLAAHAGDGDELQRRLARAMRARPTCTVALPYLAVRGRLQLAKVYAGQSDHRAARQLLHEIDEIMLRRPSLGLLVEDVSALRDLLTSRAHLAVAGGTPLTGAELRLLPYLQTHLTFREIGERLFVTRNTVATEVASIYRKLGVSSRNEAVSNATTLGLLGD